MNVLAVLLPAFFICQLTYAETIVGGTNSPIVTLEKCTEVQPFGTPRAAVPYAVMAPAAYVKQYLNKIGNKRTVDISTAKVSIIKMPTHGKLTYYERSSSLSDKYKYVPDQGFMGTDVAISLIEFDGKKYKTITNINIVSRVNDDNCANAKIVPTK